MLLTHPWKMSSVSSLRKNASPSSCTMHDARDTSPGRVKPLRAYTGGGRTPVRASHLELATLDVAAPVLAQDTFDAGQVRAKLALDLPHPNHSSAHGRQVTERRHGVRLRFAVLPLEAQVKRLDVGVHRFEQLYAQDET